MNKHKRLGFRGTLLFIIIGFALLYFTGFFKVSNGEMLQEYITNFGVAGAIAGTFVVSGVVGTISYIYQASYGTRYSTFYLNKVENGICDFIDEKGKHFACKNRKYEIGECYNVVHDYDDIIEVKDISDNKIDINNKRNYWFNCYIFGSKMENTLVLPVLYLLMLPGIAVVISAPGIDKLVGFGYCLIPLILIGYDLIYKIRRHKRTRAFDFDKAISKVNFDYKVIIDLLCFSFANAILIDAFIHAEDRILRMILGLFTFYDLCALGEVISRMFDSEGLKIFFRRIATIVFYVYFFGFLIQFDILAFRENHLALVGFSGCFWVIGIVTLIFIHFVKHD